MIEIPDLGLHASDIVCGSCDPSPFVHVRARSTIHNRKSKASIAAFRPAFSSSEPPSGRLAAEDV